MHTHKVLRSRPSVSCPRARPQQAREERERERERQRQRQRESARKCEGNRRTTSADRNNAKTRRARPPSLLPRAGDRERERDEKIQNGRGEQQASPSSSSVVRLPKTFVPCLRNTNFFPFSPPPWISPDPPNTSSYSRSSSSTCPPLLTSSPSFQRDCSARCQPSLLSVLVNIILQGFSLCVRTVTINKTFPPPSNFLLPPPPPPPVLNRRKISPASVPSKRKAS